MPKTTSRPNPLFPATRLLAMTWPQDSSLAAVSVRAARPARRAKDPGKVFWRGLAPRLSQNSRRCWRCWQTYASVGGWRDRRVLALGMPAVEVFPGA
jgi:hypothetical protein